MKLSQLKQELFKKYSLNSGKKKMSHLREEYQTVIKNKLEHETPEKDMSMEKASNQLKNPMDYCQSKSLVPLQEISHDKNEITELSLESELDQIKIIGITGSRGKSTTAYIVHEYLKSLGYKSILYSSVKIESPATYISGDHACEIPLQSEETLLNILEEAEAYKAQYLVLEINETAIEKGLTKNIPFHVRALTNLNPKHNEEHYAPQDYVRIKEAFFKDIVEDEDCTCVLGLTEGITREDFNRLVQLNPVKKITYGTKYTCEKNNADYTNLDVLLYELNSDLSGLKMKMRVNDQSFDFQTKVLFSHNAFNFTCAVAILEALQVFDVINFNNAIAELCIPGREEILRIADRSIVIGLSVIPSLEEFAKFKENAEIQNIKVVIGSVGSRFMSWNKAYSSDLYLKNRSLNRKYAMEYIKKYADLVYLTSNDPAAEDPQTIAVELQSYLNHTIPSIIEVDREVAIRRALVESKPHDIIYLAGRGNRAIFCDSSNTVKLFKDLDVVMKVVKELGWN